MIRGTVGGLVILIHTVGVIHIIAGDILIMVGVIRRIIHGEEEAITPGTTHIRIMGELIMITIGMVGGPQEQRI